MKRGIRDLVEETATAACKIILTTCVGFFFGFGATFGFFLALQFAQALL
jgi:hypothetical protein